MDSFPDIRFSGTLWPSQREVVDIAREQLGQRQSRIHVVAPPGSGKTVMGLYLWAECVKRPALVLSPNSAIQAQWISRTDLFAIPDAVESRLRGMDLTSMDGSRPALLTSLTYQAITMPDAGDSRTDHAAVEVWRHALVDGGHAQDLAEANVWIQDLAGRNPKYYRNRIGVYRKKVREQVSLSGNALSLLHPNCHSILLQLREAECGMLILDECHHLMGHWGRVLSEVRDMLGSPIVVGLTATPPDRSGRKSADTDRYDTFFGPIDFEVPVPAVVKDGYLAPYQDLAWFVRPTESELEFVASADRELSELVELLCRENDDSKHAGQGSGDLERPPWTVPLEGDPLQEWEEELDDGIPNQRNGRSALGADQYPGHSDEDVEAELTVDKDAETTGRVCDESLPRWLTRVLMERRLATGVMKDWPSFQRRDPVFADAARSFLTTRGLPLPEHVPPLAQTMEKDDEDVGGLEMDVLVPVLDRYIRHRLRRSKDSRDHDLATMAIRRLRILGVQITETGARGCASPVGRVLAYSQAKSDALTAILTAEQRALKDSIRAVVIADFEKSSVVSADVKHLLDEESGGAIAAFKTLVGDQRTDTLDAILLTGSSVLVDDDICEKFLHASREWLAAGNYRVELTDDARDSFHVINGRGSDWSPRVYVEMITELFQAGLTKCLVGTRGLLGEGWDANKINVLVDLTTATTSMTVNQLRGRSIRLDPHQPNKLANNWDVVCVAPEFRKGLSDYQRFEAKHHSLYGVTDDGAIEKGVGHVHAAFTELRPEGIADSTDEINRDMLQRAVQRDYVRQLWKVGQPYCSQPLRAVEVKMRMPEHDGFPPFAEIDTRWSAESLANAIANAVLSALVDAKLLKRAYPLRLTVRDGGYIRIYIQNATEDESRMFGRALAEALGPIRQPRYVVERFVELRTETLLSRFTPRFIGKRFVQRQPIHVMLHSVPTVLSRKREMVDVYIRHWHRLVSNGDAHYVLHQKGAGVLNAAQFEGELPRNIVREKDVFH